ncbi:SH3 domain-containing protein [Jannaschia sp. CCS1]|uniref:SH3 domain-containing protein n=1 Tax=Jannaschia sp. (strain CCS1) TaxID=290400 RepID=UPI000053AE88|nr:SH3 domain-containing protein [Jannaschia sp. CCS1]ABD56391.1 SH3 type 3 [Jannaschia sp. CCS1]
MTALFARFSLILTLLVALTSAVQASGHSHGGHGPDFWRVSGVANWDVLNVRAGPGVAYNVVDRLPHNARQVQVVSCVPIATSRGPANWCLVNWQGYQRGWVNSRFLREDSY